MGSGFLRRLAGQGRVQYDGDTDPRSVVAHPLPVAGAETSCATTRVAEFAALLVGLFAAQRAAASTGRADLLALSITLYAMTPVLLWATVRFGGAGLSLTLSATALIISNAAGRMSAFGGGVPADAIVGVQLLLTTNAVPLMLLAGLLEQNRTEHRALVDMEQRNRAMLRALPDMVLLHTVDGVILQSYPDPTTTATASRKPLSAPAVSRVRW
jgi:hypothetical protein